MGSALCQAVKGEDGRRLTGCSSADLDRRSQLVPESQRVQWAMHEVLSPETWRKGRVTLLGDSVGVGGSSRRLEVPDNVVAFAGPRIIAAQRIGCFHGYRGCLRVGRIAISTGV